MILLLNPTITSVSLILGAFSLEVAIPNPDISTKWSDILFLNVLVHRLRPIPTHFYVFDRDIFLSVTIMELNGFVALRNVTTEHLFLQLSKLIFEFLKCKTVQNSDYVHGTRLKTT